MPLQINYNQVRENKLVNIDRHKTLSLFLEEVVFFPF